MILVLGLSFYFAGKTKSASNYYSRRLNSLGCKRYCFCRRLSVSCLIFRDLWDDSIFGLWRFFIFDWLFGRLDCSFIYYSRTPRKTKVRAGKIAAFSVGVVAIILGILFKGMNVSFLVGLAFAVAASANLPSIVFILFWKKTTSKGISASIITGIVSYSFISFDIWKIWFT